MFGQLIDVFVVDGMWEMVLGPVAKGEGVRSTEIFVVRRKYWVFFFNFGIFFLDLRRYW